jgi:hypothetical protein
LIKKYEHKVLKRHELAEIGFVEGKKIGIKFKYNSVNVAEDKQVFAGLNYLGMIEGWELITIDKSIPIEEGKYGIDDFYFKRLK